MGRLRDKDSREVALLRRVSLGDETALREIEAYLEELDRCRREIAEYWAGEERRKKAAKAKRDDMWQRFERAEQRELGVDYGAAGRVLLRNNTHRLVWRSGGHYWAGLGSRGYGNADLEILAPHYRDRIELTDNHRKALGGKLEKKARLSMGLVRGFEKEIDAVFGAGATEKLLATQLKKTLVLKTPKRV